MFDPEKVERYDPNSAEAKRYFDYMPDGPLVRASDYDQLLALYRKAIAGRESFAKGMMTMRQNSHDPQTP